LFRGVDIAQRLLGAGEQAQPFNELRVRGDDGLELVAGILESSLAGRRLGSQRLGDIASGLHAGILKNPHAPRDAWGYFSELVLRFDADFATFD
jgi:hypothetical protein